MKELLPGLWHFESPAPRVNAYLWSGRRDLTLVDCGYPGHGKAMLEEIQDCGFRLADIGRIILTHGDLDHAGGLYELSHALRVPVLCHRLEAPVLQNPGMREFRTADQPDPTRLLVKLTQRFGKPFPGTSPSHFVADGEMVGGEFTTIHTPGHSLGHVSYLHADTGILLTGDLCTCYGGVVRVPLWHITPERAECVRSVRRVLATYGSSLRYLACSHGPPVADDAARRLKLFVQEQFLPED